MYRFIAAFVLLANTAFAAPAERPGWHVHDTDIAYSDLITRLTDAVKTAGFGVVTQAGPTGAAKARGITIPGNRVIGVFNNIYAVRMLTASESAMIEAPIRFYITENPDGSAALSYKTPSHVFAPYADDSAEVMVIARELDDIFADIATAAIN